jgi:aspartyl-tRNA(Asn)/glutamyl-tRNA(Gln) amidotransferase subunit C
MSKITKEEVLKISKLAKLNLTEAELVKYTKEFESILNYISMLNECDVSDIKEEEHNLKNYVGNVLYEDIEDSNKISREKVLMNATNGRSKNGYIRTSKIVNKE